MRPLTDGLRRMPLIDCPWRKRSDRNTSQCQHSAFAALASRCDPALSAYPYVVVDLDWLHDQIKTVLPPIMASGAKIGALRQARMVADVYQDEVVDPYAFTNPAMPTDGKPPRELNFNTWLDYDPGSNFRAERS